MLTYGQDYRAPYLVALDVPNLIAGLNLETLTKREMVVSVNHLIDQYTNW